MLDAATEEKLQDIPRINRVVCVVFRLVVLLYVVRSQVSALGEAGKESGRDEHVVCCYYT